jgi:hypothetical protein
MVQLHNINTNINMIDQIKLSKLGHKNVANGKEQINVS